MTRPATRSLILAMTVGFVAGVLWLGAIRFFTYRSNAVHYHANFALYINGQQDTFNNFTFYEEVNACVSDELDNPKTRVHLHDKKSHLVHVHAHAVTWGQFFENLGYSLGNTVIKTNQGVYIHGQDNNKLSFTLNGKPVDTVANRVIKSEDTLLINYGQDDQAVLQKRYGAIVHDAGTANTKQDPASCSGSGDKLTPKDRFLHAVGIGKN